jgi:rhodanese-related sulfurtransferase
MRIVHSLALALALMGGGAAVQAGDDCCGTGGGACCDAADKKCPMIVELKTEELAKIVAEKKAAIFDVNPAERYAKGHVPGATNLAFDKIEAKDLPADKTAQLVFYCASEKCNACEVAAKKACELGYKHIAVYRPGIAGWEAAKQTVEGGAKTAS